MLRAIISRPKVALAAAVGLFVTGWAVVAISNVGSFADGIGAATIVAVVGAAFVLASIIALGIAIVGTVARLTKQEAGREDAIASREDEA